MDDAGIGEPLEQRLDVGEVGGRLLAHDGLAAPVGVDAQEGLEDAALGAVRGQQARLQVRPRDPLRQPAPVGRQLAEPRASLQLARVDELDEAAHRRVVAKVAHAPEVVARALPGQQVAEVVVLGGDGDAAVAVEDAARQRRAAAADADDEDGLGLAGTSLQGFESCCCSTVGESSRRRGRGRGCATIAV